MAGAGAGCCSVQGTAAWEPDVDSSGALKHSNELLFPKSASFITRFWERSSLWCPLLFYISSMLHYHFFHPVCAPPTHLTQTSN